MNELKCMSREYIIVGLLLETSESCMNKVIKSTNNDKNHGDEYKNKICYEKMREGKNK